MNTKNTADSLREKLISSGIELLQSGGTSALTLRKCAARANVSHAAPAHHFGDLKGLLAAIASRGFESFTDLMLSYKAACEPSSDREKLFAISEGYLEFAHKNQALYNLMFTSHQIDFCDPELSRVSSKSFQVLVECCAPFQNTNNSDMSLEILLWSALHGYADLSAKPMNATGGVSFSQVFDRIVPMA